MYIYIYVYIYIYMYMGVRFARDLEGPPVVVWQQVIAPASFSPCVDFSCLSTSLGLPFFFFITLEPRVEGYKSL